MPKLICLLVAALLTTTTLAATPNLSKIFHGKNACFILYDLTTNKSVLEYHPKRCKERVFACSTFKVPLAVMAFDQGILTDENTAIEWDGINRDFPNWNQDQTPKTWLQYSTIWVSQWLTPQIGMTKIKKYLADFAYGNQDMSGGITKAWLSSSLKISAEEQINFLKNLWQNKLPVSQHAMTLTKNILPQEVLPSGDILYGKTGSGFLDGRNDPTSRMVGWYVGYFIHNKHPYAFATSSSDLQRNTKKSFVTKALSPGENAKAATEKVLQEIY